MLKKFGRTPNMMDPRIRAKLELVYQGEVTESVLVYGELLGHAAAHRIFDIEAEVGGPGERLVKRYGFKEGELLGQFRSVFEGILIGAPNLERKF